MQTYLPMIGYSASAKQLDIARLDKQRGQVLDILRILLSDETPKYSPHPVVEQWRGFEYELGVYGLVCCLEWKVNRGRDDNVIWPAIHDAIEPLAPTGKPPWIGDLNLHRSHRSSLIRKLPNVYAELWPGTPVNMPMLWPVVYLAQSGYGLFVAREDADRLAAGERTLPDSLTFNAETLEVYPA